MQDLVLSLLRIFLLVVTKIQVSRSEMGIYENFLIVSMVQSASELGSRIHIEYLLIFTRYIIVSG